MKYAINMYMGAKDSTDERPLRAHAVFFFMYHEDWELVTSLVCNIQCHKIQE